MSGAIAVTGASGQVGTLLAERLGASENLVRLGRDDDWGAAIANAAAVAHLAGTLQPKGRNSYRAANVETTERVAEAAWEADVRRIAFLSYVGADPSSENEYLRSKGEAERILAATGVPTTIFRCVHIFGPPRHPGPTAAALIELGRGPVRVPGSGKQRIAPLYIGDVVEALSRALLDPDAPTGTFELAGPEEMTMDEFVLALNGPQMRIRHSPVPVARLAAKLAPSLTPALMDLMLANNVIGAGRSAAGAFGLSLHSVGEVWRAAYPAAR
jgi:uncharacterized protein YbjT (DUF2867 family)